jgi:prepilin-type N-terminal cleavage/methylation domain-containing protein
MNYALRGNGLRSGFSLVETLVALAISLIVGGAIITALVANMQVSAAQNRNMLNQDDVRDTLAFMADEIRAMGNGAQEPVLLEATPSLIRFAADLDGDGAADRVKYEFAGAQLTRTLYTTPDDGVTWNVVATDVLLDNASALTFTYYGHGNTTNPAINDVTSVGIRLALDVAATATGLTQGKLAPQALATRATIRNRLF